MRLYHFITPARIRAAYSRLPLISERVLDCLTKETIYCVIDSATSAWGGTGGVVTAFNNALDESYTRAETSMLTACVVEENGCDLSPEVIALCIEVINERKEAE